MSTKSWPVGLLSAVSLLSVFTLGLQFYLNQQTPIDPSRIGGDYQVQTLTGEFHGAKITVPALEQGKILGVLGDNTQPKRIEVDLTNQRLYAYEGNQKVYDFLVSTGKWGRTPTGVFRIWGKYRYAKMEGGNKALHTYYYLPNVPFVMFFANNQVPASRGYSLHGTYWHNNFGHTMSHGCVNMKTEEAEIIYRWSLPSLGDKKSIKSTPDNLGTEIVIYGTPPKG